VNEEGRGDRNGKSEQDKGVGEEKESKVEEKKSLKDRT